MFSGCSDVIFDFEDGATALKDWGRTGTAFNFQPTYGDNVRERQMGQIGNPQGDYWIGTYEKRPDVSTPAATAAGDGPQGFLISPEFQITGLNFKFLYFLHLLSTRKATGYWSENLRFSNQIQIILVFFKALTLYRLGGGGGLLTPAPNLNSSQFQTI